jgi:hypothetical protein
MSEEFISSPKEVRISNTDIWQNVDSDSEMNSALPGVSRYLMYVMILQAVQSFDLFATVNLSRSFMCVMILQPTRSSELPVTFDKQYPQL